MQGKEQREPGLSPWPRKQKIVRLDSVFLKCVKQMLRYLGLVVLPGLLCFGQSPPTPIVSSPPSAAQQKPGKGTSRERGIAYYRAGKLIDAERAFAAAMVEDPADLESVQMRGLTLYRLGQPAAAHRLLRVDIQDGRPLTDGLAGVLHRGMELGDAYERAFEETRVFPAVRPS